LPDVPECCSRGSGPLRKRVVQIGVFVFQLDRFACDEKLFDVRQKLQRVAIGQHDVGDLSLLNAADLICDIEYLRRIQRDRLQRFVFIESKTNRHAGLKWKVADAGRSAYREGELDT